MNISFSEIRITNMIKLYQKVTDKITLACSGGPDSMAALNFLDNGKREILVAHFDHKTDHSPCARNLVEKYCKLHDIPFVIGNITRERKKNESPEEYWRNERHKFFESLPGPVVTAHQLNDVVEWWIFTSLNGNPQLMSYENKEKNIIKPFILTRKEDLMKWLRNKRVPYVLDPSNHDEKYMRGIIRNDVIPAALRVNPGLEKVIKKKLVKKNAQG